MIFNKSVFYSFLIFIFLNTFLFSQIKLLPGKNIFQPITANYNESRIGLAYYPKTGYFKVDAGKSFDLITYKSNLKYYSFGTEFFMHGLGLNIKEKRLPIDAADGYFGVNFNYKDSLKFFNVRLRVLHNSAHFVDGHIERKINYQPKENYVNDFFDFTFQKYLTNNFYLYSIINYPIIIHPKELHKLNLSFGFELLENIFNNFWNNENKIFFAYQFNLLPIPKYIGSNHIMTGINFGNEKTNQLKIYFSFYNGEKLFKQYYGIKVSEYSFGFYIE
ncbi:MAG: hypothetical protein N2321_09440 [Melioribacteraceae bacterium]|nr:hypothetical protein [Melioribacteraceae bacterium]